MPEILERLEKVKEYRLSSPKEATRRWANKPYSFTEIRQPDTDYLLVPSTTSENRKYVPIGFLPKQDIASNATLLIPNATLYLFGVLTSNVHMAWMRVVCGRLKSDYRYSNTIVYNNFPWPDPTVAQKQKIEETALAILKARDLFPDSALADLYDDLTMPPDLLTAHQQNDRAVMAAYGFETRMTESECVAALMKMYEELAKGK